MHGWTTPRCQVGQRVGGGASCPPCPHWRGRPARRSCPTAPPAAAPSAPMTGVHTHAHTGARVGVSPRLSWDPVCKNTPRATCACPLQHTRCVHATHSAVLYTACVRGRHLVVAPAHRGLHVPHHGADAGVHLRPLLPGTHTRAHIRTRIMTPGSQRRHMSGSQHNRRRGRGGSQGPLTSRDALTWSDRHPPSSPPRPQAAPRTSRTCTHTPSSRCRPRASSSSHRRPPPQPPPPPPPPLSRPPLSEAPARPWPAPAGPRPRSTSASPRSHPDPPAQRKAKGGEAPPTPRNSQGWAATNIDARKRRLVHRGVGKRSGHEPSSSFFRRTNACTRLSPR